MAFIDYAIIILLVSAFGAQVFLRSFCARHIRKFFYASVLVIFSIVSYWSYLQYKIWEGNPISKFLLPPYQPITYFVGYVGSRLFAPWLLALAAAMLVAYAARYLNRRFENRFFEKEEIQIIGMGIFLTGWPGFLFYIPLVLIVGLLSSSFYFLFFRGRAPLYFLWLPLAILVILTKNWLIPQEILRAFIL